MRVIAAKYCESLPDAASRPALLPTLAYWPRRRVLEALAARLEEQGLALVEGSETILHASWRQSRIERSLLSAQVANAAYHRGKALLLWRPASQRDLFEKLGFQVVDGATGRANPTLPKTPGSYGVFRLEGLSLACRDRLEWMAWQMGATGEISQVLQLPAMSRRIDNCA